MEFQVNQEIESYQSNSTVAKLSNGNFVVTWESNDKVGSNITDNDAYHIAAQIFNSNGDAVGDEFQVNTEIDLSQHNPSVSALGDGFVITWDSEDTSGSGDDDFETHIAAQIFTADGSKLNSEFQVNTHTSRDQNNPTVTELNDSNFIITWESSDRFGDGISDNQDTHIAAQILSASGSKVGSEFQVNTQIDSYQSEPAISVLNSNGDFIVVWQSQDLSGLDSDSYHISAQRYSISGNTIGNEFQINSETDSFQINPSVVSLANGGFVVVWQSLDTDGTNITDTDSYHIAAQVFDADGIKVSNELQINSETESSQSEPSIVALSTGGFVVAWQSLDTNGTNITDTDSYHIAAQIFDAAGNKVDVNGNISDEFQINIETEGNQFTPSISALDNGDFVITWESNDTNGTGISDSALSHIAAQIFDICDSTLFRLDSSSNEICTEVGYFFDLKKDGDLYGSQPIDYAVYDNYNVDDVTIEENSSLSSTDESIYDITYNTGLSGSKNYTESLHDVERLQFDDKYVALDLDIDESSGAAFAILFSVFNDVIDSQIAGKWISSADKYFLDDNVIDENEYIQLAQEMIDFYAPTGVDNQVLVDILYANVAEDSGTYDESLKTDFLNELENGSLTQASLLSIAAQTEENQNHYASLIGQGWQYDEFI